MKSKKIRVLVVDDSAFMRKALKRMLNSDSMITVIGDARDGAEALDKIKGLRPDVVTLDVQMSGMDGIRALKRIMSECPVPVLMVSSLTSEGGSVTLEALESGAVDFIDKSSCHTAMDILDIADSLVQKVKVIAGVDLKKVMDVKSLFPEPLPPPARPAAALARGEPTHIVAIGSSTGGPMALERILKFLPPDLTAAFMIVQHMPEGFTRSLAERLDHQCAISIKEAEDDDRLQAGRVYIAPAGYHLGLRRAGDSFHAAVSRNPQQTQHRPSVDIMFRSVAETWPGSILAVVLTGMGQDGAEGVKAIKARGGTVLAQDEQTCVVYGMPKSAFETGCVDRLVPIHLMAAEISRFNP